MPRINLPDLHHAGPVPTGGWHWLPYTDDVLLATLRQAFRIIGDRITGYRPCNAAFQALPGGRTFAAVWNDPTIWISYDPDLSGRKYGATLLGTKEVSIARFALQMGHWTTAATLVHELAHTNGADRFSHAAEGTLRRCLLRGLENPIIMGSIDRVTSGDRLA